MVLKYIFLLSEYDYPGNQSSFKLLYIDWFYWNHRDNLVEVRNNVSLVITIDYNVSCHQIVKVKRMSQLGWRAGNQYSEWHVATLTN